MSMKFYNKKGQIDLDGLFMLFANFVVIGLAVTAGVFILYGAQIDVRLDEAQTISNHVVYAISDNGYLNDNLFDKNFDLIKSADLDPNQFQNGGKYYVNVGIFYNNQVIKVFDEGTKDFGTYCTLSGKNLPKCYYKSFILVDGSDHSKFYTIKILTASNNLGVSV